MYIEVIMKVIQGSVHQGDHGKFKYYGRQCCAISVVSCGYAQKKDPVFWTTKDIDACILVSLNRR